ncbi:PAS domain-containing protein [Stigmatella sp. ncwal1]|uniref:histidine kinase n=1 Tax=Stigmatella ashevillensis TaxID=2995309 RepID=A0ABT5DEQ7_9BACT|nr:ATP-binding protein [Stigmatella ashevillena]MDC0712155.1 PAS domain-containing protein [Stigmatella ashevillena]
MNGLARLLSSEREALLQRVVGKAQVLPPPGWMETLPRLLDGLQAALESRPLPPREAPARQPLKGADASQLRSGFGLVRDCVLDLWEEAGETVDFQELKVLHHFLDQALEEALTEAAAATARQSQMDAQVEAQVLLDTMLATAPVGLCFVSPDLRFVHLNRTIAAINGVPVEQSLGRPLRDVVPELASVLEPLYQKVLQTGEPVLDFELTGTTPGLNGEPGFWVVSCYPVKDAQGRTFLMGSVVVDLTERKRSADAVASDAAKLEAILQSIPDAVYVGDARHIKHANARARELLGEDIRHVAPQELGRRLACRTADTDEALAPENEPFTRALAGEAFTHELVLCHVPSGKDLWVRFAAAPVRMGERIASAVVIVTDLTEHQKRESELRRAAEFRERFLGIVSHDLRNPLNAIALSAGALVREEGLPARAMKTAGRIVHSTERMGRMIGELLDFTRGRLGGGIPIARKPGDLRPLCRHVLDELRVARPEREVRLKGEGQFQGEWDGDRLAQLVGNLAKNALDYSPDDTPVTVTLYDDGPQVRLEVHNEGEPIPASILPELFEPFRRGAKAEDAKPSGLGLGLFIARQIALAHGGRLEVRSTKEEGTRFTVYLPRAPLAT